MNLQKAIEINTKLEKTLAPTMAADGTDAIKLGIEALERLQESRKLGIRSSHVPLLGEIEE